MNKLEFGKLVARDINGCSGLVSHQANVFGGFVRDMLAGDEPHDLDVLCDKHSSAIDIVQFLLHNGYTLNKTESIRKRNPGYGFSFSVMLISVSKKENQIDLDIVKSYDGGECFNPDVDVNRLVWDPISSGIGTFTSDNPHGFGPITANLLFQIKEKRFKKAELGISRTRTLNMESKGWEQLW
jgi:hypothetical protein